MSFLHLRKKKLYGILVAGIISLSCKFHNSDLKKNEIARIDYAFSGCFGAEEYKLTLYEKNGSVVARLDSLDKAPREALLSPDQIHQFNSFAEKIKDLKEEPDCMSTSSYSITVYTIDRTIRKVNIGCNLGLRFDKLKNKLFWPNEIEP